jgi:putative toxin-antitoxin system antitoxin component (TIGR02293 family)
MYVKMIREVEANATRAGLRTQLLRPLCGSGTDGASRFVLTHSASTAVIDDRFPKLPNSNSKRLRDRHDTLDMAPFGATMSDIMASELRAIVDELGGEGVLKRRLKRDGDLQAAIRDGFPQKVIDELMEAADLTIKELAASLDLSPRSLQRRRREGRLAPYESDRIYRLARIVALAKSSLGSREGATRWLKRPNRALGGKAPLAMIDTEIGARAVENVLGRIAFGGVS